MILNLYILFVIIAFVLFFIALFVNKSVINIFIWPVVFILFGALFFASYNIETASTVISRENLTLVNDTFSIAEYEYDRNTTNFTEPALNWMFLALAMLSIILFLWDIWQVKSGKYDEDKD